MADPFTNATARAVRPGSVVDASAYNASDFFDASERLVVPCVVRDTRWCVWPWGESEFEVRDAQGDWRWVGVSWFAPVAEAKA